MRILLLAMLGCIVLGCSYTPRVGAPWMQDLLKNGPEGASPMFQEGWRDGCETGISATSNAFQRHFFTFKQNSTLASNHEYYTAWKSAYNYCQRYVFQYLRRNIL